MADFFEGPGPMQPEAELAEMLGEMAVDGDPIPDTWFNPSNPKHCIELVIARLSVDDRKSLVAFAAESAHAAMDPAYRSPHSRQEAEIALKIAFGLRPATEDMGPDLPHKRPPMSEPHEPQPNHSEQGEQ